MFGAGAGVIAHDNNVYARLITPRCVHWPPHPKKANHKRRNAIKPLLVTQFRAIWLSGRLINALSVRALLNYFA